MRIFLDANILFSAAKTDGAIRQLLQLLRGGGHALYADDYVVAEARRNLKVKAAGTVAELEQLLRHINVAPIRKADLPPDIANVLPEKDWPVLAAAIGLGCDVLVTGDRTHFGTLYGKIIGGVLIHSPRSLAESLRE